MLGPASPSAPGAGGGADPVYIECEPAVLTAMGIATACTVAPLLADNVLGPLSRPEPPVPCDGGAGDAVFPSPAGGDAVAGGGVAAVLRQSMSACSQRRSR